MAETLVQSSIQDQILALAAKDPEQFQNMFRIHRGTYPEKITRACLLHLAEHGLDQAGKQMIGWLCSSADYFPALLDRQIFPQEAAKRVLAILSQADQQCVPKLVNLADQSDKLPVRRLISRALELVDVFTNKDTLIPWLRKLTNSPDARIQSKAIKMLCELRPNRQLIERQLNSSDERVRASVIEASWHQRGLEAEVRFRRALEDSNHRVVANALVGLYLMGDATAFDHMAKLTEDPSPMVRRSIIWALGYIGDRRGVALLEKLSSTDESPAVRNKAAQALASFPPEGSEFAGKPGAEMSDATERAALPG